MFRVVTPYTLLHQQVCELRRNLPGVFDGQASSIHDARVATRRVREVLPLVADRRQTLADLAERFRQMGRSLGRVRDADVRIELLASLEGLIPHAAPSVLLVRQRHERERLDRMRRLIKRFERLDVAELLDELHEGGLRRGWLSSWAAGRGVWRRELLRTLGERSVTAAEAIAHATGVYFPNRVHAARIAIKKLRYALEIAQDTGLIDGTDAIDGLKKGQDVLGNLHDRQELIDELGQGDSTRSPVAAAEQIGLVIQLVEAECRQLHHRYLTRRTRLIQICLMGHSRNGVHPRLGPAVTVGAVALSSGYLMRRFGLPSRST